MGPREEPGTHAVTGTGSDTCSYYATNLNLFRCQTFELFSIHSLFGYELKCEKIFKHYSVK